MLVINNPSPLVLKNFQMKYTGLVVISLILSMASKGQHTLSGIIKDRTTGTPIPGATISIKGRPSVQSNDSGLFVFSGLQGDTVVLNLSHINYKAQQVTVIFPDSVLRDYFLDAAAQVLDDVTIISTTRTNQRMENAPLKVEVLGKEDMDEENTIRPANIASILGDVSGIQIQQSSAVSGNANVRIQGLEGRYTQLLRDGMPLYDGFSGNFGMLTIPPLDLRQIELVKGSASTLYGGGAIGGLINLISKNPVAGGEEIVTLNQTSRKESDANLFVSQRDKKAGFTFFTGYTRQTASDVNKDGFSDLPRLSTVVVHPRIFLYPGTATTLIFGYTGTFEKRTGGDMIAINDSVTASHNFFEANRTQRNTGEFIAEHHYAKNKATVKASVSSFDRITRTNWYSFKGQQLNYYTEASLLVPGKIADWVAGINFIGDRFREKQGINVPVGNFSNQTAGAFVQQTLRLPAETLLETGLRFDHHNRYGWFILPRIALFHRFNKEWATRFGFGGGYKTPNPLAPQSIEYDIRDILPIGNDVRAEKSYGFNAELNYRISFGEKNSFFINQAFFLTRLIDPVIATVQTAGVGFSNGAKPVESKGSDTYIQLALDEWEVYAGYTYTIAERKYLFQNQFMPLTPRNRFAFTLVKEFNEKWRMGLEGSFTGAQYRDGDSKTPGYFFMAAMAGRNFGKHLGLVLNGENLLDYRQSKKEALYTGSMQSPIFKPLWAPIDGRIINLSLRWKS